MVEEKNSEDIDETKEDDIVQTMCTICQENISTAESASIPGCGHRFCVDCITDWANQQSRCPNCRAEFNTIIKPNGEEINVQSRSQLINYTFRDLFDSGIIRESEREQQINELRLIEQRRRLIEQRRRFDSLWFDWPNVLTEEVDSSLEANNLVVEEVALSIHQEEEEEEEQEQQRRRQQERANRIQLLSNHMSTEQAERLLERQETAERDRLREEEQEREARRREREARRREREAQRERQYEEDMARHREAMTRYEEDMARYEEDMARHRERMIRYHHNMALYHLAMVTNLEEQERRRNATNTDTDLVRDDLLSLVAPIAPRQPVAPRQPIAPRQPSRYGHHYYNSISRVISDMRIFDRLVSLPLLNHNDTVDQSDDDGDDTNVQTYELLYRQRIQKESTDDKEQNNTYTINATLSNIYYINDFHDNSKHLYTNRFLYMLWEPIDYGE